MGSAGGGAPWAGGATLTAPTMVDTAAAVALRSGVDIDHHPGIVFLEAGTLVDGIDATSVV